MYAETGGGGGGGKKGGAYWFIISLNTRFLKNKKIFFFIL